jgi:hypothetical protein
MNTLVTSGWLSAVSHWARPKRLRGAFLGKLPMAAGTSGVRGSPMGLWYSPRSRIFVTLGFGNSCAIKVVVENDLMAS